MLIVFGVAHAPKHLLTLMVGFALLTALGNGMRQLRTRVAPARGTS